MILPSRRDLHGADVVLDDRDSSSFWISEGTRDLTRDIATSSPKQVRLVTMIPGDTGARRLHLDDHEYYHRDLGVLNGTVGVAAGADVPKPLVCVLHGFAFIYSGGELARDVCSMQLAHTRALFGGPLM
jgi:hypothetical protein